MLKADRVLSTPPTNALTDSAPGAVQLSSPPVIPLAPVDARQGVKTSQNQPAVRRFRKAGPQSVGGHIMNMFVGSAAVAGAAALSHQPAAAKALAIDPAPASQERDLREPTLANLIDNLAVTKAAAEPACTMLSNVRRSTAAPAASLRASPRRKCVAAPPIP